MSDLLVRLCARHSVILKNLSWMMVSELLARISRFVTLFVLAACFTTVEYGTVMLALVCHELLRVFARLGIGAHIIRLPRQDLEKSLGTALVIQWCCALLVATTQIAIADWVAVFYDNPALSEILRLMAISHIIYPIVAMKVFLLQRDNRFQYYGIASGFCVGFENLCIALLVWLYSDMMMVAVVKNLAAVFWVIIFFPSGYRNPKAQCNLKVVRELVRYSSKVLGSDLMKSLRWQIDSLLAAKLLSPEVFGIYSFAKSASVGIGQTLTNAFVSSIYPYLCQMRRKGHWHVSLKAGWIAVAGFCLVFVLQAIAAPYYIVWLFGDRWVAATQMAALLCLLSIPVLFLDYISNLFRAVNMPGFDLLLTIVSVIAVIVVYMLALPKTGLAFVVMMLIAGSVWMVAGWLSYLLYIPGRSASLPLVKSEALS